MLSLIRRLLLRDVAHVLDLLPLILREYDDTRRVAHAWMAADPDTSCHDPFETCTNANCELGQHLVGREVNGYQDQILNKIRTDGIVGKGAI